MRVRSISSLILLVLLVVTSRIEAQEKHDSKQSPNILFAFADDWGRFASAYQKVDGPGGINDAIQTPNFDRIAREGVLFRNAFVSAPSCTPCRSALLSGQHFWRTGTGSILRGATWDQSLPAYPLLLRDHGYHIGKSYKVWSPGTPVDAPYGGQKFGHEKKGGRFNQFSENVTKMVEQGMDLEKAKEELYQEVVDNFTDFLDKQEPGKPFCFWFGPTNVHRTWVRGSGKKLWGIEPDSLKGKLPAFLPDVPEVREDLADYFGEAQAYDAALGKLLKKLEEVGQLDNTLIVVSGDHGAPGFPHGKCNLYDFGSSVSLAIRGPKIAGGRVVDDMVSLTDLAPTFLDLAGVDIPESMTGRSLVSILNSDKQGIVEPKRDAIFIGRERHVEDARADFMPYPQRAIRTRDFLYIVNFRPDRFPMGDHYKLDQTTEFDWQVLANQTRFTLPDEDAGPTKAWLVQNRSNPQWQPYFDRAYGLRPREELYDLRSDPHQVVNVAGKAEYQENQALLHARLMKELIDTKDPRMIEDGKFYETPPMSGPVNDPPAKRNNAKAR